MKELEELTAFGPSLEQLFCGSGLPMEYFLMTFLHFLRLGGINKLHLSY